METYVNQDYKPVMNLLCKLNGANLKYVVKDQG